MRSLFLFLAALLLQSCASPKTVEEYREALKSHSSFADKFEFDIPASLEETKLNLEKYANKCFKGIQASSTSSSTTRSGGVTYHNISTTNWTYKPLITQEGNRVSMTVQKYLPNMSDPFDTQPKDGFWLMVADLDKTPTGVHASVQGQTYGIGKLLQYSVAWLKNEKKQCPELP